MKKKGFTLVELLAVIVILAIIAIIATPMILNVIENAKKGATEASALGYIDAIEKSILEEELKGNIKNKNKVYNVSELDFVNIKGDKPTEGWIRLKNGTVDDYELKIGNYIIKNIDGKAKAEKGNYYLNGTVVYFNPETNEICDDYIEENSKLTVKTGCMKWYIFNDSESSSTVNMILDHNTTSTVAWNSTGSNTSMNEVATALTSDTTTWDSSLNARLITADEIGGITGNTTFSNWFYLDSNSQTQTSTSQGASKYSWLYDYTDGCESNGCNIENSSTVGYWTSTSVSGNANFAWRVTRNGNLYRGNVDYGNGYGVRPVITISKSVIS